MRTKLRLKDICFYKNGTTKPLNPNDKPICRVIVTVEDIKPEYFEMIERIEIEFVPKK